MSQFVDSPRSLQQRSSCIWINVWKNHFCHSRFEYQALNVAIERAGFRSETMNGGFVSVSFDARFYAFGQVIEPRKDQILHQICTECLRCHAVNVLHNGQNHSRWYFLPLCFTHLIVAQWANNDGLVVGVGVRFRRILSVELRIRPLSRNGAILLNF